LTHTPTTPNKQRSNQTDKAEYSPTGIRRLRDVRPSAPRVVLEDKAQLDDKDLVDVFGKDADTDKALLLQKTNLGLYRRSKARAVQLGLLNAL
jgi:hypothetical protein